MADDNGNGKEQTPQQESPTKKTHEQQMQEFAGKLNDILSAGYSLPAVIQVLDSALFEMKISLYFRQIEMMEKQSQKLIQTPAMRIPTDKLRKN